MQWCELPVQKWQTKQDFLILFKILLFLLIVSNDSFISSACQAQKKGKDSWLISQPKFLGTVCTPLRINLSFNIIAFIAGSSWLSLSSCSQLEESETVNWLGRIFPYILHCFKSQMLMIILPGRGRCKRRERKNCIFFESGCCALIFWRRSWRIIIRNEEVACILTYKLPVSLASLLRIALNISDCSSLTRVILSLELGKGKRWTSCINRGV